MPDLYSIVEVAEDGTQEPLFYFPKDKVKAAFLKLESLREFHNNERVFLLFEVETHSVWEYKKVS